MAQGNETSAIYLDVFTNHYGTLVETLPVKLLAAKFVSAKIIKFSDKDEILKGDTAEEKTHRFLQHIVNPLKSGNSETFLKMLVVTEKHGGQYVYFAQNTRRDLSKRETSRETIIAASEDNPDNPGVIASEIEAQGSLYWFSILCKVRIYAGYICN